jgi:hypothetical protein
VEPNMAIFFIVLFLYNISFVLMERYPTQARSRYLSLVAVHKLLKDSS